ncbi:uncharacterized protein LOC116192013 [Punica granatum]|uniref:Uncharacterized protein n=2 Tax=Punica granatum TaxID=22663 RepID=A0A218X7G0_PUNGR|nr:uncharacterized protein LOC116192013 [Punica granatum]OWM80606.1 hypothetical protein CDL15_Pgr006636 [Punica granatum]PKI33412.1 hypothetical protein CRG98_046197 [Punica granatum]
MENDGTSLSLPANFVTIKDLQERWLKRRQEQQQQQQLEAEKQESGKDEETKQARQQQPESRSRSQPPHTSGHVQTDRGAGKLGRIGWEPPRAYFSRLGGSGRWWSDKEGRIIAKAEENRVGTGADGAELCETSGSSRKGFRKKPASKSHSLVNENAVEAEGAGVDGPREEADGENSPLMKAEKDESRPKSNGALGGKGVKEAIGGTQKPSKGTPRRRVSSSKGVQDKFRPESSSSLVEKGMGKEQMDGVADVPPEEAAKEGSFSRKSRRPSSKSKSKRAVVENGEVAAEDGQAQPEGAPGEGPSSKKDMRGRSGSKNKGKVVKNGFAAAAGDGEAAAAGDGEAPAEGAVGESVPLRKDTRVESRSKNKNIVKEDQVEMAEVSSSEGIKDGNGTENRSTFVQLKMAGGDGLVLPEEAAKESAQTRKSGKKCWKSKSEKDVSVGSKLMEVEAGQGIRDVVGVNMAPEVEWRPRHMSTEDNDRKGELGRPIRMEDRRYRRDSHGRSKGRKDVRKQISCETVWVKKGETATGGASRHSSASLEWLD